MMFKRLAVLLFVAALPALAFAQDASGPDSSAIADQTQPGAEAGNWLIAEPGFVSQGLDLATRVFGDGMTPPKTGFYPEFSNMITGSGVISVGPGYRYNFKNGNAFIDMSAAVSWHLYNMAQIRIEAPQLANDHVTFGAQAMYQDDTQVSYYGIGPDHVRGDQAQYRLKTADFVGYMAVRPVDWLSFDAEGGWLKRPQILSTSGTFNPNYPDARVLYAGDPAMNDAYQPNFVHSEFSLTANTLDSRSHPTYGGLYRAALSTFWDESTGKSNFNQWEAEFVQMVPLGDRRFVLGLHGWTVHTETGASAQVPFYLLPYVGGNNTLRGYDDYEFHDLNTLVGTAELRVAVLAHMDLAAFYDAGNVAARYRDLDFDKTSWGAGLRLHLNKATFARMDVAHGSEGWRFVFRTSDPFKLSRVTRRLAAIPFMP